MVVPLKVSSTARLQTSSAAREAERVCRRNRISPCWMTRAYSFWTTPEWRNSSVLLMKPAVGHTVTLTVCQTPPPVRCCSTVSHCIHCDPIPRTLSVLLRTASVHAGWFVRTQSNNQSINQYSFIKPIRYGALSSAAVCDWEGNRKSVVALAMRRSQFCTHFVSYADVVKRRYDERLQSKTQ